MGDGAGMAAGMMKDLTVGRFSRMFPARPSERHGQMPHMLHMANHWQSGPSEESGTVWIPSGMWPGRQRRAHGERPGLSPLVKHCVCNSQGCRFSITIGVSNLYPMESILQLWIGLKLTWNELSMVFSATTHNR